MDAKDLLAVMLAAAAEGDRRALDALGALAEDEGLPAAPGAGDPAGAGPHRARVAGMLAAAMARRAGAGRFAEGAPEAAPGAAQAGGGTADPTDVFTQPVQGARKRGRRHG